MPSRVRFAPLVTPSRAYFFFFAQRRRAREYVNLVLAQRVGPVSIDFSEPRDDLSVVRFFFLPTSRFSRLRHGTQSLSASP